MIRENVSHLVITEVALIHCNITNIISTNQEYCKHFFSNKSFDQSFEQLLFESTIDRTVHTTYYLPTLEIKGYNAMIDGKNFFDHSVKE